MNIKRLNFAGILGLLIMFSLGFVSCEDDDSLKMGYYVCYHYYRTKAGSMNDAGDSSTRGAIVDSKREFHIINLKSDNTLEVGYGREEKDSYYNMPITLGDTKCYIHAGSLPWSQYTYAYDKETKIMVIPSLGEIYSYDPGVSKGWLKKDGSNCNYHYDH